MCSFFIKMLCKILSPGGEKEQVSPFMLYLVVFALTDYFR
jgi:hypothetical protein